MSKALAAHAPDSKRILENGDSALCLRPASLQPLEFPGTLACAKLLRIARTDSVINPFVGQTDLIGLAVESAVGSHCFKFGAVGRLHPAYAAGQQGRVGWGAFLKQFPVKNDALGIFGQGHSVAELDFGPSLA